MSNPTPERAYEIFIETYHLMNNNLGAEPNQLIGNSILENESLGDYIDIHGSFELTENAEIKQGELTTVRVTMSPESDIYICLEISEDDKEGWNEVAQKDLQDLLEDARKVMINIITRCRAEGLDIFVFRNPVEGENNFDEKLFDQKWMEEFKAKLLPLMEPDDHAKKLIQDNAYLEDEMQRARQDERIAMSWLEDVRKAAGHDGDFPSLVEKVSNLSQEHERLEKAFSHLAEQVESLKACIGAGATFNEVIEILLTIPSERQVDDPLAAGSDQDFGMPDLK